SERRALVRKNDVLAVTEVANKMPMHIASFTAAEVGQPLTALPHLSAIRRAAEAGHPSTLMRTADREGPMNRQRVLPDRCQPLANREPTHAVGDHDGRQARVL